MKENLMGNCTYSGPTGGSPTPARPDPDRCELYEDLKEGSCECNWNPIEELDYVGQNQGYSINKNFGYNKADTPYYTGHNPIADSPHKNDSFRT